MLKPPLMIMSLAWADMVTGCALHGGEIARPIETVVRRLGGSPLAAEGAAIFVLESSCLFAFRRIPALVADLRAAAVGRAMLFEKSLASEAVAGRLPLPLRAPRRPVLLHGHLSPFAP